jgi:hypothetical protein
MPPRHNATKKNFGIFVGFWRQFRKNVNFEIRGADRIFLHFCMVDMNTIITFGFYQWKNVLASSSIMGLKCKLYLKVRPNSLESRELRVTLLVPYILPYKRAFRLSVRQSDKKFHRKFQLAVFSMIEWSDNKV